MKRGHSNAQNASWTECSHTREPPKKGGQQGPDGKLGSSCGSSAGLLLQDFQTEIPRTSMLPCPATLAEIEGIAVGAPGTTGAPRARPSGYTAGRLSIQLSFLPNGRERTEHCGILEGPALSTLSENKQSVSISCYVVIECYCIFAANSKEISEIYKSSFQFILKIQKSPSPKTHFLKLTLPCGK